MAVFPKLLLHGQGVWQCCRDCSTTTAKERFYLPGGLQPHLISVAWLFSFYLQSQAISGFQEKQEVTLDKGLVSNLWRRFSQ